MAIRSCISSRVKVFVRASCVVVLWVLALVRAAKGSEKPVPVLGEVQLLKKR